MRPLPPFRWLAPLFSPRFRQIGLWPGLLCGVFFVLIANIPPLRGLERSTLDMAFKMRGPRDVDTRVVVIAVDNNAMDRAGQQMGVSYPLPRVLYAEAITKCKEAGARTIALDVLFLGPGVSTDDSALVTAVKAAGNVVTANIFRTESEPQMEVPATIRAGAIPSKFAVENRGASVRKAVTGTPPFSDLVHVTAGMGHVMVFPDDTGTLRTIPHLLDYHQRIFPSLALAASANFLGMPQSDVIAEPGGVRLGQHFVPLESNGDAPINWIGANQSYPTFPLYQLLDGKIPPEALRDRLVLIGVTADGAFENRATPFSTGQPALEFQANAIDDILSKRPLLPVTRLYPVLLTLALPVLCSVVMVRRVPGGVLWLLGTAILIWLLSLALLNSNQYLPVGVTLLAGMISTGIGAALGYRREWDSNVRADAAVAALARGTTLLGAALSSPATGATSKERLQSVIRVTARETLGANEVFLVLLRENEHQGSPLREVAERAFLSGHTLVWPPMAYESDAPRGVFRRLRWLRPADLGGDARLFESAEAWVRTEAELGNGRPQRSAARNTTLLNRRNPRQATLIAAPLPKTGHQGDFEGPQRVIEGALVAIGRRDGGLFTLREAVLLEALARQAAMALDNWEYSEALRGRVELANEELRNAYRLLAEQSAKLFTAVESIEAALVICEPSGVAAFVNASAGRVLRGATPILGESVAQALRAGDLDELADLFESWIQQGPAADKARIETMRGRDLLSAQFTPLVDDDGNVLGAMLVVADVTAQRELDRMKTDFVGFVAHELRTPLTTILGYASLLDQTTGRLKPEQMHDMTSVITRHCRRMNRLINDLLDISRLEAGQPLPLQQTFFDLNALLQRLVEEQKSQLNPFPPITLALTLPPTPVEIMGDPDRMEQVVINVLTNAIKYSPEGGQIDIVLTRSPEHVHLEFRDQGMGMSAEQLSNLFQKFYRTADARQRGIKGTGLGLHLVKQIVESHGGTIEVQSTPGRGSTFRLTLPGGLHIG